MISCILREPKLTTAQATNVLIMTMDQKRGEVVCGEEFGLSGRVSSHVEKKVSTVLLGMSTCKQLSIHEALINYSLG